MPENTEIGVVEQREVATTPAEVKNDVFSILETEPTFQSDNKGSTAEVTKTPEEIAESKAAETTAQTETSAQLVEKAKELGLPETATADDIKVAEAKIADELKTKAVELGLPETATKDEIAAAELAKTETEGFVTDSEVQTGILGAEDGTWKALMLAEGLEVPADYDEEKGFEIYKQAESAKWQSEIEKAKAEAQESVLSTLKPELRAAIELANSIPDMTIEQVLSPTLEIDNLLKLDKESLVREEVKANFPQMTEEMVDIKMQEYKDAGTIDTRYDMVKLQLETNKKQIQDFHNQKIQEYQAKQQQSKIEAVRNFNAQTSKALDGVQTFLDKKITDIDRQFLRNKIDNGAIDKLRNDPVQLARAIAMLEFYDKGITGYENRVREKVLLDHKKNLHNTPVTPTTGGGQPVVAKQPIKSGFDILD